MLDIGPQLAAILLSLIMIAFIFYQRKDVAEYRAFKEMDDPANRANTFRIWILKAFTFYTLLPLLIFLISGRIQNFLMLPSELRGATERMFGSAYSFSKVAAVNVNTEFLTAMMLGLFIGLVLFGVATSYSRRSIVIGDVDAMMPRNSQERRQAILLTINAAVGEELFFRALLPILFVLAGIDALFAIVLAALIFGFAHLYQGVVAVFVTGLFAIILQILFAETGSLLVPMVLHLLVNLNGFFLRPWLAARLTKK